MESNNNNPHQYMIIKIINRKKISLKKNIVIFEILNVWFMKAIRIIIQFLKIKKDKQIISSRKKMKLKLV